MMLKIFKLVYFATLDERKGRGYRFLNKIQKKIINKFLKITNNKNYELKVFKNRMRQRIENKVFSLIFFLSFRCDSFVLVILIQPFSIYHKVGKLTFQSLTVLNIKFLYLF